MMPILQAIELYSLVALLICGFIHLLIGEYQKGTWQYRLKHCLFIGVVAFTVVVFGNGIILLLKAVIMNG